MQTGTLSWILQHNVFYVVEPCRHLVVLVAKPLTCLTHSNFRVTGFEKTTPALSPRVDLSCVNGLLTITRLQGIYPPSPVTACIARTHGAETTRRGAMPLTRRPTGHGILGFRRQRFIRAVGGHKGASSGMKVTEISGSSAYQTYLQLALDDAVTAYQVTHEAVSGQPPLTEETATPQLTLLHYRLEQQRATALLLAACCVEALGNLYLAHKSTPEQFAILEWAKFLDKWTVLPSLFVPDYSFPRDGELYQDLKRLNARRNASTLR